MKGVAGDSVDWSWLDSTTVYLQLIPGRNDIAIFIDGGYSEEASARRMLEAWSNDLGIPIVRVSGALQPERKRRKQFRVECLSCGRAEAHFAGAYASAEAAQDGAQRRSDRWGCRVRVVGPNGRVQSEPEVPSESLAEMRALVTELRALVDDRKEEIRRDLLAYLQEHLPEGSKHADHVAP